MTEHRAGSRLELHEFLFADSWNDELGLFRARFAAARRQGAPISRAGSRGSAATPTSSGS